MQNNITRADLDAVIGFLSRDAGEDGLILTQSRQVRAFEEEWSQWLGVKHSVLVNSGASANLITMAALRRTFGPGEVIVPPITWVSDVAAVIQCGFTPVFADIDPRTLGMDNDLILDKITADTRAVFITHVLGYNALGPRLIDELARRDIPLIEDVCESHGACMDGRKLGTFGLMSNFSFYYAHHMSTIEGGMVSTGDRRFYEMLRMFRSHGMVRECSDAAFKEPYHERYPDLTPDFIFAFPAYNMRSTEINAVLGRSQLKRLDANNAAHGATWTSSSATSTPPSTAPTSNRGELQLRLHAGASRARQPVPRPRRANAPGLRRRVSPRHVRRREPTPPAVLAQAIGRRRVPAVPPRGSHPLLRFLPGELPLPGRGKNPAALCHSQRGVRPTIMPHAHPHLVLVNPASRARVYQSLADNLSAIEPPIWAGLMATYVRNKGFGVEIIDAEAEGLTAAETAQRCQNLKPALVAVVAYGHQPSASTQVMPSAGAVVRELKNLAPESKVLMIGGHVSALPERTLREEAADFVAGGEGLVTLVELLAAIEAGDRDYAKVSDLYYRDGAQVVSPARHAPLIADLDAEMPGIAWDLLPMEKYRAHNWHCMGTADARAELARSPYAAVYTTLGCPFKCSFCCIQAPFRSGAQTMGMKGNSYRYWNPRRVVDNLQHLVERYGVRNVKFADELFVLNKSHVQAVCEGIIERGLDLNIWAYARVDTVRDDQIDMLAKAGIRWLAFGIEAANSKVRDNVQKGFDQQDIRATLTKVWNAGIHVIGNYIFGLPEDDLETMQQTLDLALDLKCEFGNFYCAMAYPGSKLYNQAIAQGWELPKTWVAYSQHSVETLPLPTRYLSGPEVLAFRDRAFQRYYTDPAYLARVERKFGEATVRHLREMTSHKLVRRHVPAPHSPRHGSPEPSTKSAPAKQSVLRETRGT